MNVSAIISSRWNSKRFKGKALIDLAGKPVLQRVYDRVKLAIPNIIVATTDNSQPIVEYCKRKNIEVFISNQITFEEENLILRMVQCGDYYNIDVVVRVWGDCPFIDPILIEQSLGLFEANNWDYFYPINLTNGLSFAIYRHSSFIRLFHIMSEGDKWYWNHVDELQPWLKEGFRVHQHDFGMGNGRVAGLNINTPQDLEDAHALIETYGENISYGDIRGK